MARILFRGYVIEERWRSGSSLNCTGI